MGRKKVSTTVYLEPEQLEQLVELRERTRVPMATIVREALDLGLPAWKARYAPEGGRGLTEPRKDEPE